MDKMKLYFLKSVMYHPWATHLSTDPSIIAHSAKHIRLPPLSMHNQRTTSSFDSSVIKSNNFLDWLLNEGFDRTTFCASQWSDECSLSLPTLKGSPLKSNVASFVPFANKRSTQDNRFDSPLSTITTFEKMNRFYHQQVWFLKLKSLLCVLDHVWLIYDTSNKCKILAYIHQEAIYQAHVFLLYANK